MVMELFVAAPIAVARADSADESEFDKRGSIEKLALPSVARVWKFACVRAVEASAILKSLGKMQLGRERLCMLLIQGL